MDDSGHAEKIPELQMYIITIIASIIILGLMIALIYFSPYTLRG